MPDAVLDGDSDEDTTKVSKRTPLHVAAQNGDTVALKELVKTTLSPNGGENDKTTAKKTDGERAALARLLEAQDDDGQRALHLAARQGHATVVQDLLDLGAQVDATNRLGDTALMVAAGHGQLPLVRFLLDRGANPLVRGFRNGTALHRASAEAARGTRLVAELLREPAVASQVGLVDDDGNTGLHLAAGKGNAELAGLLLDVGAPLDLKNSLGSSALHLACTGGHLATAELLLARRADIEARSQFDRSPLHCAIQGDHVRLVELLLLQYQASFHQQESLLGGAAVHVAAMYGAVKSLALLLDVDEAALVRRTVYEQLPALHVAAVHGQPGAIELLLQRQPTAVEDKDPRLGRTPLHLAALHGRASAVATLLHWGAYVDSKEELSGASPLHFSCYAGHFEATKCLVNNGANKASRDTAGDTCLHYAVLGNQPDIIAFLLSRGTETGAKDFKIGRTPLHDAVARDLSKCAVVLLGRANIEVADDENGASPLHLASWFGRLSMAELLLSRRASLNLRDRNNYCPVHYAAMRPESTATLAVLLRAGHSGGANLRGGAHGRSPLHIAAQWGLLDSAQLLLDHGADPELQDGRRSARPLHLAARHRHAPIVRLLLQTGASPQARDDAGWTPLHVAVASSATSSNSNGGQSPSSSKSTSAAAVGSSLDCVAINESPRRTAPGNSASTSGISHHLASSAPASSGLLRSILAADSQSSRSGVSPQLQVIRLLLDADAQLLERRTWRLERTALMCAAATGQLLAAEALLAAGTDAEAVDHRGKSPLKLAFDNGHYDVVKMFVNHHITK